MCGCDYVRYSFLGYNQILSLEAGSFNSLPNLEWLKLNKNRLRYINKSVFNALHRLKYLYVVMIIAAAN